METQSEEAQNHAGADRMQLIKEEPNFNGTKKQLKHAKCRAWASLFLSTVWEAWQPWSTQKLYDAGEQGAAAHNWNLIWNALQV